MAPMVTIATTNVSVTPGAVLLTRRNQCLSKYDVSRKSSKQTLPTPKYILPLSTSIKLFPHFRVGCILQHKLRGLVVSATETDVAVEEVEATAADDGSGGVAEASSDAAEISEESSVSDVSPRSVQSKRSRPARKSEMPPVKNEDLIPGATFPGKVRSIQPFGAFIDFGAFTDGLVHVSRLSDSYVKDVGSIVSVGQEVTVRLVEANTETGRISLTMRESDDPSRPQQQKDAPTNSDRPRTQRKSTQRNNQRRDEKVSKFVKGQDLEGTVKNLTRSGAFISLPEGEEGFLPASEETDEVFGIIDSGSSLTVGQEVNVRVLRIARGQVTLTMKKEEAASELDSKLNQGVVYSATNPFLLAFRSNKEISSFLDEREKEDEQAEQSKEDAQESDAATIKIDVLPETTSIEEESVNAANDGGPETINGEEMKQNVDEEVESAPEGSTSTIGQQAEVSPVGDAEETEAETGSYEQAADQISASETVVGEEVVEKLTDDNVNVVATEIPSVTEAVKETEETSASENDSISSPTGQSEASLENSKDEESQDGVGVLDTQVESAPSIGEQSSDTAAQQEEGAPNTDQDIANSSEQNGTASLNEAAAKAISPALVKQLREETGAAVYAAMKALNFDDVKMEITETGWPSKGDENETGASTENAAAYNGNLVKRVLTGSGTPLKPDEPLNVYLFALFNENQKPGPVSERNYGLFYPSKEKVYDITLTLEGLEAGVNNGSKSQVVKIPVPSPSSSPTPAPVVGGGVEESKVVNTWCVANEKAGAEKLQAALDYACGEGGADCRPIQPGATCHNPDTLEAHASYAFNSYYQKKARGTGTCDFKGAAYVVTQHPKYGSCKFPTGY